MAMFAFLLDPGRAAAASVAARACSNCSQVVSAASICKRLQMRNLAMPKNANSNSLNRTCGRLHCGTGARGLQIVAATAGTHAVG
mgnify:CR=1 FL=1